MFKPLSADPAGEAEPLAFPADFHQGEIFGPSPATVRAAEASIGTPDRPSAARTNNEDYTLPADPEGIRFRFPANLELDAAKSMQTRQLGDPSSRFSLRATRQLARSTFVKMSSGQR